MARALSRALAAVGWTALGLAAFLGVAVAGLSLLASAPFSRAFVASRVVGILDDRIAGSVALDAIEVLPSGGIELRGLEIVDPEGRLVLSVGRARVALDLTLLRRRAVGIAVELDAPSVLVDEDEGGGASLVRAFAPARAPAEPGAAREDEGGGAGGWTLFLSRLRIRSGDVWWVEPGGGTRLEASGLDVDARGLWGPGRALAELRLEGALAAPLAAPVALEVAGSLAGDALRLPVLRARLGGTSVALAGEGDVARRTGRLALLRVSVARELARAVAPGVPRGGDVDAAGYAESDGATLTAALRAGPAGADGRGGADAAIAVRLSDPARALGFDVALDRLDPSRVAAGAPPGEITLAARGAASGRSRGDLRGRIEARLARSRLRAGEIAGAELVARADRGTVEVSRATLAAPGLSLDASGRWRDGGAVEGRAVADAGDLAAAARNAGALLGSAPAPLRGRARVEATLGGTAAAPSASASVDGPEVGLGAFALSGVRLAVEATGPARAATARVEGRVASVRSGGTEIASGVSLRGVLAEGKGTLEAAASLPGFDEPARIAAAGRLSPALDALALSTFSLAYPGSRWTLSAPATVALSGPSVDRLELAEGAQRVVVAGGLDPRGALDARAAVTRLDLARLPAGLLPAGGAVRGELSAEVRAAGTSARPEIAATFELAGAAFRDLAGIAARGAAEWSAAARRAKGVASLSRGEAKLDVAADLPLPIAGRPAERVQASVRAAALPAGELLAAAGLGLDGAGELSVDGALEGTAGAPTLRLRAGLSGARLRDLDGLGLEASLEDAGERVAARASLALAGRAVAAVRAEAPLVLADLLARPADALRALRAAPLAGSAEVTGLELASLAGRAGAPAGMAGRIDAAATLSGSIARPRAEATLDLAKGAWGGWRDVGARARLALASASTSLGGTLALEEREAVRYEVTLGAPPERLASLEGVRAAPLTAEVVVPGITLDAAGPTGLPLSGTLSGRLAASGTPGAPEATLRLEGDRLAVSGRALGRARLEASYAGARAAAALEITPPRGGPLRARASLRADLGLGARRPPLGEAPAELALAAEDVDLSLAAALLPGTVRSSSGTLAADVTLRGPLARLAPRGTLRVSDGRVAVVEYGEFSGIAIEAEASEEAIAVGRLEVRRDRGRIEGSGALRGLSSATPRLEARLEATAFAIARAGMPVATLDLRAEATGARDGGTFAVEVTIPRGVVRLPDQQPRALHPTDARPDVVIGRPEEGKGRRRSLRAAPAPALSVRAVVPRALFVKGDKPRVDLELKGDVTWETAEGEGYVRGHVETVRGTVEPIAGRTFTLERGRVQFSGGPPTAATLDFEARYTNPVAVVTAKISGPLQKPDIALSSQPPMDEAQIAMLIATGQRELKAGTGSVGTLTGEEAGRAALGALATTAFRDLVADKLPIDTFSLDSGALRAGKYVTDKIYVGYVRRFEADTTRGENTDEVRVEYHVTPRWVLESRYGTAQSGAASLIWTKDY